ncbi:MAG: hypothetical protein PHU77_01420 [Simplicispira sp.]|nr:hypothetical protein [Simplicispira sp.]
MTTLHEEISQKEQGKNRKHRTAATAANVVHTDNAQGNRPILATALAVQTGRKYAAQGCH